MKQGLVDTTVIVHLFRRYPQALTWYSALTETQYITPITWLEVLYGSPNKTAMLRCKTLLEQFQLIYLTPTDMDWAIEQMAQHRFSQGIGVYDCLIASVCHRLDIPIFTDNLKDFLKILPSYLVIKPY